MKNEEKAKEILGKIIAENISCFCPSTKLFAMKTQNAIHNIANDVYKLKDEQFKEDIHKFCRYCESKMPKGKSCAFRSLGNEYCDFIEDMFKKY